MSYDLSSSASRLAELYLDNAGLQGTGSLKKGIALGNVDRSEIMEALSSGASRADTAKEKYGKEFAEVYDSLQAMRTLNGVMRQSYEMNHRDDDNRYDGLSARQSAMSFSKGGNRILDMLTTQAETAMQDKVNKAMKDGMEGL